MWLSLLPQDSQAHRVIEKRRRDRINNSLADLASLLAGQPDNQRTLTKHAAAGQGRVKKTEIIEMAIQRIHQLQSELLGLYGATLSIFRGHPNKPHYGSQSVRVSVMSHTGS